MAAGIENLSLLQRDCDVRLGQFILVKGIENLSLLQRDCDLSSAHDLQSLPLLKTCPCFKGIATNVLSQNCHKNGLKTCPCFKGIATAFGTHSAPPISLKTCPCFKGIATWLFPFGNVLGLLKTCPCFKGIATPNPKSIAITITIENLSLLQRDCDRRRCNRPVCRLH